MIWRLKGLNDYGEVLSAWEKLEKKVESMCARIFSWDMHKLGQQKKSFGLGSMWCKIHSYLVLVRNY